MKIKTLTITILILFFSFQLNAIDIWVSPNGNDSNSGTKEKPLKTVLMAVRKIRELRRLNDPSIKGGVHIILKGGLYQQVEPVILRPEDSGTEDSPTWIEAAPGEAPVISGGMVVAGWKLMDADLPGLPSKTKGKIWVADIPKVGGRNLEFRQLWINNNKAVRASNLNDGTLDRILSVNKAKQELWIPIPKTSLTHIDQLEFVIHQWWAIAILRVKSIDIAGDSARVTFYQPESHIEFEHPWPAPFIDEKKDLNGNSAFYFANAPELLNQPGEWFEDVNAGKVYYWPKDDENLAKDEVVVPYLENILSIKGTLDNPVSHIYFKGVQFEHAAWMRPSKQGHVPLQAGWSITDAYKLLEPGTPDKAGLENQAWIERQSAGVTVENANNIHFQRCRFQHMAGSALDFVSGTNHNLVEGCIINDIGGTGLQMGFFGSEVFEAHVPYNPTDEREVCQFETIKNNLITDCTNEDWGCVGISVGYAQNVNIEHNEVSNLNYSGICIGWGWTKTITCMKNNRVHANYIHHFAKNMYDVGGIYTLSAQPNTEISENRIENLEKAPYAHIPEHYQYIYFDEGSSYIRSINNWTEKDKFFSNTPGPGNEWKNNGPEVSDEIKNKAGLEAEFKDLHDLLK
ncbi:MAG: right-handed parallel beta-helix repeat-containing protein [Bacteroidales bacterium]|nr:right-handed parallel beta-helix repeat-containing protein [Bacteroidales bacterium]